MTYRVDGVVTQEITAENEVVPISYRPIAGVALNQRPNGAAAVQVTGTWTGTLSFEVTLDGSTFVALLGTNVSTGAETASTTANGLWRFELVGAVQVRVRASAAMTGTAVVSVGAWEG
jgi:hypothetical protein